MTTLTAPSIYEEYQEGNISALQVLRTLCMTLGELESDIEPLSAERERLRDQIGDIVARMDNQKAEIPDFGTVRITSPSISEKYDTKQVDAIVFALVEEGYSDIAERIIATKSKSMRAGGLRIEKVKRQ